MIFKKVLNSYKDYKVFIETYRSVSNPKFDAALAKTS